MTRTQEIRPDLDEGIDRKVLAQLRARFLTLNQARLARAHEGLSSRQQLVLKLLPLFFHVNHPSLPGYVSSATPAGIAHYQPDPDTLAEVQRLTRSFAYKPRHGNPPRPIQGLFLMGSLGTLAQAEQSDLDVWVCHAPDLCAQELDELRRKCALLETWADTQGAEAHFFLIDPQRFVRGERDAQLSSEDCGTTQHYLLLDEFYRTALWLAGRTPLWWLVPVYEEGRYDQYTGTLLHKRFIRGDDCVDLGHLAHIPAGEYVGAGLWQLYKGIESPYKSVLKLLLTEVYASEHPQVECLSLRYKRAVFANQLDLDELDPYIMVYRRIEEYLLARNEPQRLELVRRSLYLKVNKRLTGLPRFRALGWQRQLLARLAAQWGWDARQLALLDSRSQWKVRQVISERRDLVSELNHSYRFLNQFAKGQHGESLITRRDLNILGRRLYAAFERTAGKIEFINPGIAADLAEDTVTLVQAPNRRAPGKFYWSLYTGNLGVQEWEHFAPLKRCHELLELLAWSHRNGVIDSSTRIALYPGTSDLSESELFNLLTSLQQSIPLPLQPVADEALLRPSRPCEVLLTVNVGVDPLKHHRDLNIHMTTQRTDSLSYAGVRENLVLTLDQVTLNSWNEVSVARYAGSDALLDCMVAYLQALAANAPAPRLRVRCFCHNRATAIAQRVEALLIEAQRLLQLGQGYRFVLQVQQRYHVLALTYGQVSHTAADTLRALLAVLSQERSSYSPLQLDPSALQEHELSLLLPQGQPGCVQVFFRQQGDWAQVYVLDELNALWQRRLPFHDENSLLLPLQRFLESILHRREALQPAQQPVQVRYHQITPAGAGQARRLEPWMAPADGLDRGYYAVQAIVGRHGVTLYCDQKEFSTLEYGDQLYAAAAAHIIGRRHQQQRYRCYITDLDLGPTPASTQLYLRHKSDLEDALAAAVVAAA